MHSVAITHSGGRIPTSPPKITPGLLVGLLTRLATIPLLIDISVAIATTKLSMLTKNGVWAMLHEARTDFSMLLGLMFLLIAGAGSLSLDERHH